MICPLLLVIYTLQYCTLYCAFRSHSRAFTANDRHGELIATIGRLTELRVGTG